MEDPKK
jgi:hypothetical protein